MGRSESRPLLSPYQKDIQFGNKMGNKYKSKQTAKFVNLGKVNSAYSQPLQRPEGKSL